MNCTRCRKPITFVMTEDGKNMPVDERMVYVVQDSKSRLRVLTRGGHLFAARLSTKDDEAWQVVKAYMPHWINCGSKNLQREAHIKAEFAKREAAAQDSRIAAEKKRFALGAVERPKLDQVEQLALF